jgi:hypothetical protein
MSALSPSAPARTPASQPVVAPARAASAGRRWAAPVVAAVVGGLAAAAATWGWIATQTLQMSVGAGGL